MAIRGIGIGTFPGWTGPPERRRAYFVPDRTVFLSGGIGIVYRASLTEDHQGLPAGTPVAVKLFTDDDSTGRFAKLKARSAALAQVHHPRLARLVEVFVGPPFLEQLIDEDQAIDRFAVHVWVEGQPLAQRCIGASPEEILRWGAEVAEGLDALHTHPAGPFAHRDVHPNNVVIGLDDHAVLIDYDTILVEGPDANKPSVLLTGTRFSPAERSLGLGGAQRDDRWSLARTFAYCLAGNPSGELRPEDALGAAQDRLEGVAADPVGVIDRFRAVLDGDDPASAMALFRSIERPMRRRRILPRLPDEPRTRRTLAAAGIAIILAITAAITVPIVTAPPPSSVTYAFAAQFFSSGLVIHRTWTLGGPGGRTLTETLEFSSATPLGTFYPEVIPHQVATATDAVTFIGAPYRTYRSSPHSPMVAEYSFTLGGASRIYMFTATLRTPTPAGDLAQRIAALARDQRIAEAAWITTHEHINYSTTLVSVTIAQPVTSMQVGEALSPTLAGGMSNHTPATAEELADIAWSSSDTSVLTVVSPEGTDDLELSAVGAGTATLVAQFGTHRQSWVVHVAKQEPTTAALPPPAFSSGAGAPVTATTQAFAAPVVPTTTATTFPSTPSTIVEPTTTTTQSPAPPVFHYFETPWRDANTWSNYANGGGTAGKTVTAGATVQIACRIAGAQGTAGDPWWYKIVSGPWNGKYYAPAGDFYNDEKTTGAPTGSPSYDPIIPLC